MQLTSHYNSHRTSLFTMSLVHLCGVKIHFMFQLWTVQRTASHVWKLAFADWHLIYAFENLSLYFVYGHGKACGQRYVSCQQCGWLYARHSMSFAAVMAVWCATLSPQWRHIGTTSESGCGYVDDITWIRTEVRVVGRIDAIRLKNASKRIVVTIFKMLTWKKTGPGYDALLERKTPARQCATAENTWYKECAGTLLLYRFCP
jgi:hypothetical protein